MYVRATQNEVLIIRRSDKRSSVAVIIIWQLQRFMSDAESPDMDGKLQVYRLEKRKGEVDDANIIAGKRVRPQDPAPMPKRHARFSNDSRGAPTELRRAHAPTSRIRISKHIVANYGVGSCDVRLRKHASTADADSSPQRERVAKF